MTESSKAIIISLGMNNKQTFTELSKSTKLTDRSLSKGLDELKLRPKKRTQNYIYSLPEPKNRTLQGVIQKLNLNRKPEDIERNLKENMKELKEYDAPFELGMVLLNMVIFNLSRLTVEKHSTKLSDIEKFQFEKAIEYCNTVIESTIKILNEIDEDQTAILRKALGIANSPIGYTFNKDILKPKQWRIVKKIQRDIIQEMSD